MWPTSLRHQAGEADAVEAAAGGRYGDAGGRREKRAAAGILHDVGQKAARAAGGAVLIVDVAIDVARVGRRNQPRGIVLAVFRPGRDGDLGLARGQGTDRVQGRFEELARERPEPARDSACCG